MRHSTAQPARKAQLVDLVSQIRRELDRTTDDGKRGFLIGLASDLLRRRQTLPVDKKRGRRWR